MFDSGLWLLFTGHWPARNRNRIEILQKQKQHQFQFQFQLQIQIQIVSASASHLANPEAACVSHLYLALFPVTWYLGISHPASLAGLAHFGLHRSELTCRLCARLWPLLIAEIGIPNRSGRHSRLVSKSHSPDTATGYWLQLPRWWPGNWPLSSTGHWSLIVMASSGAAIDTAAAN